MAQAAEEREPDGTKNSAFFSRPATSLRPFRASGAPRPGLGQPGCLGGASPRERGRPHTLPPFISLKLLPFWFYCCWHEGATRVLSPQQQGPGVETLPLGARSVGRVRGRTAMVMPAQKPSCVCRGKDAHHYVVKEPYLPAFKLKSYI